MVEAVREGISLRAVARRFHVSLDTVQRWLNRAKGKGLDEVDWNDLPHIPRKIFRTPQSIESQILSLRRDLKENSALGDYGANAIHEAMRAGNAAGIPSIRTIGRILSRCGALDGRRRIRFSPPPVGWYLPDVAAHREELDSFDAVEDLTMVGNIQVDILTCVSVLGGLAGAWPGPTINTKRLIGAVLGHWQTFGLPTYAQFDNAPYFTGAQRFPNVLGRMVRICLSLGVTPVFAPPHEIGFQSAIESLNSRWQSKVWQRFRHPSMEFLCDKSDKYIAAYRTRLGPRIEAAPARRRFPARWKFTREMTPRGRIVYIRRADDAGKVRILGQVFDVSTNWTHRLIRCEAAISSGRISFYGLRRRCPGQQTLLRSLAHNWVFRPLSY